MKVHLVDGTYELFRAYFALPSSYAPDGRPVNAVRGLLQTLLSLLRQKDVTHIACAFDHTIESFRNELFESYKTSAGSPKDLRSQFELAERGASALGIVVWPMVRFEADDAIATAVSRWKNIPGVDQIVICSPDKDLTQIVHGRQVVCLDRRRNITLDEAAVESKFGVLPRSIPDYLALVGDSSDGIPGIPRWGPKVTSQVLRQYIHLEHIPLNESEWGLTVRGARSIAKNLEAYRDEAILYKQLTILRIDVPLSESLADLEWRGVRKLEYVALCRKLGFEGLAELPHQWDNEKQPKRSIIWGKS